MTTRIETSKSVSEMKIEERFSKPLEVVQSSTAVEDLELASGCTTLLGSMTRSNVDMLEADSISKSPSLSKTTPEETCKCTDNCQDEEITLAYIKNKFEDEIYFETGEMHESVDLTCDYWQESTCTTTEEEENIEEYHEKKEKGSSFPEDGIEHKSPIKIIANEMDSDDGSLKMISRELKPEEDDNDESIRDTAPLITNPENTSQNEAMKKMEGKENKDGKPIQLHEKTDSTREKLNEHEDFNVKPSEEISNTNGAVPKEISAQTLILEHGIVSEEEEECTKNTIFDHNTMTDEMKVPELTQTPRSEYQELQTSKKEASSIKDFSTVILNGQTTIDKLRCKMEGQVYETNDAADSINIAVPSEEFSEGPNIAANGDEDTEKQMNEEDCTDEHFPSIRQGEKIFKETGEPGEKAHEDMDHINADRNNEEENISEDTVKVLSTAAGHEVKQCSQDSEVNKELNLTNQCDDSVIWITGEGQAERDIYKNTLVDEPTEVTQDKDNDANHEEVEFFYLYPKKYNIDKIDLIERGEQITIKDDENLLTDRETYTSESDNWKKTGGRETILKKTKIASENSKDTLATLEAVTEDTCIDKDESEVKDPVNDSDIYSEQKTLVEASVHEQELILERTKITGDNVEIPSATPVIVVTQSKNLDESEEVNDTVCDFKYHVEKPTVVETAERGNCLEYPDVEGLKKETLPAETTAVDAEEAGQDMKSLGNPITVPESKDQRTKQPTEKEEIMDDPSSSDKSDEVLLQYQELKSIERSENEANETLMEYKFIDEKAGIPLISNKEDVMSIKNEDAEYLKEVFKMVYRDSGKESSSQQLELKDIHTQVEKVDARGEEILGNNSKEHILVIDTYKKEKELKNYGNGEHTDDDSENGPKRNEIFQVTDQRHKEENPRLIGMKENTEESRSSGEDNQDSIVEEGEAFKSNENIPVGGEELGRYREEAKGKQTYRTKMKGKGHNYDMDDTSDITFGKTSNEKICGESKIFHAGTDSEQVSEEDSATLAAISIEEESGIESSKEDKEEPEEKGLEIFGERTIEEDDIVEGIKEISDEDKIVRKHELQVCEGSNIVHAGTCIDAQKKDDSTVAPTLNENGSAIEISTEITEDIEKKENDGPNPLHIREDAGKQTDEIRRNDLIKDEIVQEIDQADKEHNLQLIEPRVNFEDSQASGNGNQYSTVEKGEVFENHEIVPVGGDELYYEEDDEKQTYGMEMKSECHNNDTNDAIDINLGKNQNEKNCEGSNIPHAGMDIDEQIFEDDSEGVATISNEESITESFKENKETPVEKGFKITEEQISEGYEVVEGIKELSNEDEIVAKHELQVCEGSDILHEKTDIDAVASTLYEIGGVKQSPKEKMEEKGESEKNESDKAKTLRAGEDQIIEKGNVVEAMSNKNEESEGEINKGLEGVDNNEAAENGIEAIGGKELYTVSVHEDTTGKSPHKNEIRLACKEFMKENEAEVGQYHVIEDKSDTSISVISYREHPRGEPTCEAQNQINEQNDNVKHFNLQTAEQNLEGTTPDASGNEHLQTICSGTESQRQELQNNKGCRFLKDSPTLVSKVPIESITVQEIKDGSKKILETSNYDCEETNEAKMISKKMETGDIEQSKQIINELLVTSLPVQEILEGEKCEIKLKSEETFAGVFEHVPSDGTHEVSSASTIDENEDTRSINTQGIQKNSGDVPNEGKEYISETTTKANEKPGEDLEIIDAKQETRVDRETQESSEKDENMEKPAQETAFELDNSDAKCTTTPVRENDSPLSVLHAFEQYDAGNDTRNQNRKGECDIDISTASSEKITCEDAKDINEHTGEVNHTDVTSIEQHTEAVSYENKTEEEIFMEDFKPDVYPETEMSGAELQENEKLVSVLSLELEILETNLSQTNCETSSLVKQLSSDEKHSQNWKSLIKTDKEGGDVESRSNKEEMGDDVIEKPAMHLDELSEEVAKTCKLEETKNDEDNKENAVAINLDKTTKIAALENREELAQELPVTQFLIRNILLREIGGKFTESCINCKAREKSFAIVPKAHNGEENETKELETSIKNTPDAQECNIANRSTESQTLKRAEDEADQLELSAGEISRVKPSEEDGKNIGEFNDHSTKIGLKDVTDASAFEESLIENKEAKEEVPREVEEKFTTERTDKEFEGDEMHLTSPQSVQVGEESLQESLEEENIKDEGEEEDASKELSLQHISLQLKTEEDFDVKNVNVQSEDVTVDLGTNIKESFEGVITKRSGGTIEPNAEIIESEYTSIPFSLVETDNVNSISSGLTLTPVREPKELSFPDYSEISSPVQNSQEVIEETECKIKEIDEIYTKEAKVEQILPEEERKEIIVSAKNMETAELDKSEELNNELPVASILRRHILSGEISDKCEDDCTDPETLEGDFQSMSEAKTHEVHNIEKLVGNVEGRSTMENATIFIGDKTLQKDNQIVRDGNTTNEIDTATEEVPEAITHAGATTCTDHQILQLTEDLKDQYQVPIEDVVEERREKDFEEGEYVIKGSKKVNSKDVIVEPMAEKVQTEKMSKETQNKILCDKVSEKEETIHANAVIGKQIAKGERLVKESHLAPNGEELLPDGSPEKELNGDEIEEAVLHFHDTNPELESNEDHCVKTGNMHAEELTLAVSSKLEEASDSLMKKSTHETIKIEEDKIESKKEYPSTPESPIEAEKLKIISPEMVIDLITGSEDLQIRDEVPTGNSKLLSLVQALEEKILEKDYKITEDEDNQETVSEKQSKVEDNVQIEEITETNSDTESLPSKAAAEDRQETEKLNDLNILGNQCNDMDEEDHVQKQDLVTQNIENAEKVPNAPTEDEKSQVMDLLENRKVISDEISDPSMMVRQKQIPPQETTCELTTIQSEGGTTRKEAKACAPDEPIVDMISPSDLLQGPMRKSGKIVKDPTENSNLQSIKEGETCIQVKETEIIEENKEYACDEEEKQEDHLKMDSSCSSDALVIVEASRDIELTPVHKKSHNILSGVGSKVKHSIAKVKKAIIGKSSHHKPSSPQ